MATIILNPFSILSSHSMEPLPTWTINTILPSMPRVDQGRGPWWRLIRLLDATSRCALPNEVPVRSGSSSRISYRASSMLNSSNDPTPSISFALRTYTSIPCCKYGMLSTSRSQKNSKAFKFNVYRGRATWFDHQWQWRRRNTFCLIPASSNPLSLRRCNCGQGSRSNDMPRLAPSELKLRVQ